MADEYIKRSDAIMAITRAKLPDKTPEGIPIANGKRSVTDCVRRIKAIRAEDVVPVLPQLRGKDGQGGRRMTLHIILAFLFCLALWVIGGCP